MDTQKQQIVDRVKQANNILVTVKSNPTVDHLAACIGLTVALNKLGKHATAVFSGAIPSTLEFLQPEKTLEKNTDSLRDFIIALDKSKADKLRYKVEDKVVKIFITPYRTSIGEQDLNFSQGDFNVDVVLALGIHAQADLDLAITAHGRILHDATIASVNVTEGPTLGGLTWTKSNASSLSELVVELLDGLDQKLLDSQIATALLTGIVAETERFSNDKTSPQTMSVSAQLMAAGANQQLVASKLAEPPPPPVAPAEPAEPPAAKKNEDGTLEIEHEPTKAEATQIDIDENGSLRTVGKKEPAEPPAAAAPETPEEKAEAEAAKSLPEPAEPPSLVPEHTEGPHMILEPPTLGGQLTASANGAGFFDPMMDTASGAPATPPTILNREPLGQPGAPTPQKDQSDETPAGDSTTAETPKDTTAKAPAPPLPPPSSDAKESTPPPTDADLSKETLSDIEKQLNSPHVGAGAVPLLPPALPASNNTTNAVTPTPPPAPPLSPEKIAEADLSNARDAVEKAIHSSTDNELLEPIKALNAQPVDLDIHSVAGAPVAPSTPPPGADNPAPFAPPGLSLPGVQGITTNPTPSSPSDDDHQDKPDKTKTDPNAPPPVPPPMLPPPMTQ